MFDVFNTSSSPPILHPRLSPLRSLLVPHLNSFFPSTLLSSCKPTGNWLDSQPRVADEMKPF